MTSPASRDPFIAARNRLLSDVTRTRAAEASQAAARTAEQQRMIDLQDTPRFQLGAEALAILDTITGSHKRAEKSDWRRARGARLIGRSAVILKQRSHSVKEVPNSLGAIKALETEPLLLSETREIDPGVYARHGYVARAENGALIVRHQLFEQSGKKQTMREWTINTQRSNDPAYAISSVDIAGTEFSEYRRTARGAIFEAFQRRFSWARDYAMGAIKPGQTKGRYYHATEPRYLNIEDHDARAAELSQQLDPVLFPSEGWDYPDSMIAEPLSVLQQLHAELERTNH